MEKLHDFSKFRDQSYQILNIRRLICNISKVLYSSVLALVMVEHEKFYKKFL